MRKLRVSLVMTGSLVLGAASVGAVTGQNGAEPEYAAISGGCDVSSSSITGPVTFDETGSVPYAYGMGYGAEARCTMDDPRLSGDLITTQNYIQLAPGDEGGFVRSGRSLLQNDVGSWLIEYTGYTKPGASAWSDNTYWNIYTGQGGYEGLSAIAVMLPSSIHSWDIEGVIFPGPMPEPPDYPQPPAE